MPPIPEKMRSLLELLGIVDVPASRREPVALPRWTRWFVPSLVVALVLASMFVYGLARMLVS